jgi:hypothetical protein
MKIFSLCIWFPHTATDFVLVLETFTLYFFAMRLSGMPQFVIHLERWPLGFGHLHTIQS